MLWIYYIIGSVSFLLSGLFGFFAYQSYKNKSDYNLVRSTNEFKAFWYKNRGIIWFMLSVVLFLATIAFFIFPSIK